MRPLFGILIVCTSLLFFSCSNTDVSNKNETLTETTFEIEGMTCQMGCANSIEEKLASLGGVKNATVSFKDEKAIITYNSQDLNEQKIKQVVESLGGGDKYEVLNLNSKTKTSNQESVEDAAESSKLKDAAKSVRLPIHVKFPNIFEFIIQQLPKH